MATSVERGAGDTARRDIGDGAEIGGECEHRARYDLSRAIASEKIIVGNPARRHDRRAQQRQDDMAAAKHQRAGAVYTAANKREGARPLRGISDSARNAAKAARNPSRPTPRVTGPAKIRSCRRLRRLSGKKKEPREAAERDRARSGWSTPCAKRPSQKTASAGDRGARTTGNRDCAPCRAPPGPRSPPRPA